MLTVLAAWDSLHGLKVDDITKEHTSPASDVLCLFMDMEDDKQQTKDQTKDQMKALSSELGVPLRACSSRALYLSQEIRYQIYYSTQSQVHGVNKAPSLGLAR